MTVVVGYLATAEGRQGLASAVTEAGRRSTDLVVVVSEKSSSPSQEVLDQRAADMAGLEEQAGAAGVSIDVRVLDERHDVADDLIAVAEEVRADVIVIGLRRRSPVGKLILGSNAQRILLESPCPVLAVKPQRQGAAQ
ncbi:universal stress protein [Sanguibacter suaedae]|uniref:Universal stress protein n=1 Tax=Sanguibacter suaedae TaxID=2795737 RepID=A0A934M951_9MICO|nr:universal stress protein [Sanguibacter suaedae]MBI9114235.1 universal stress protein [Sanguibacter suaedae]